MKQSSIKTVFFTRFRDASYTVRSGQTLIIGGLVSRAAKSPVECSIDLVGDGARVLMCYAYIGYAMDAYSVRISITHRAKGTSAYIYGRGVLSGAASSDIRGSARIEKNAHQADTYFSHHALLLSDSAHSTAVPSLEIEADDVSARHAATTSPLDSNNLVYVRTRGLSASAATVVLVNGFLSHDINRLPSALARRFYRSFRLCKSLENT
ncbi:SufD family Fe-S cluster assembly protein [Candidatus Uhrbacteria bacterium]|nr:SufD family Fe-S cluster assembly protein [Candidatus Uhrbacteria bacterium]